MITKLSIKDAVALHKATPGSVLEFDGVEGVVYTDNDIPTIHKQLSTSPQEFRDRFTDAELLAVLTLSNTDTQVKVILFKLQTASDPISLDNPTLIAGMSYLVSIGALTSIRRDEILA